MNTCEDETEPLGESPAIDTLGAINRAAEIGMLSPADKATATEQLAERQGQALNKIRARAHEALKYPRSQAYNEAVLREIAAIAEGDS